jgi:hypothetical protein
MLKQIGAIFILVVFFTQYFSYGFMYTKYIRHHDCKNELVCKKATANHICCIGSCELKKDFENLIDNLNNNKNNNNVEKQLDFIFYKEPNYYFSKPFFAINITIYAIKKSAVFSEYLSSIFHPPSCSFA